jgi:hypothetical protein
LRVGVCPSLQHPHGQHAEHDRRDAAEIDQTRIVRCRDDEPADRGPHDRADTADAERPAETRRAHRNRIAHRRERGDTDLRTDDADTGKHQDRRRRPLRHVRHRRERIEANDGEQQRDEHHAMRAESVH